MCNKDCSCNIKTKSVVKKKREKSESFVCWKSDDDNLEVTEIIEKCKHTKFKVICKICSKDPELFPDGYFVSTKSHLKSGRKPCGCSKRYKWLDWQFLILARREGEKKGFIVHGFAEEFRGNKTKINCKCLKDGYEWKASINNIMRGRGCPRCRDSTLSEQRKTPEYIALQKCIDICEEMNYEVVGFPDGYNGIKSSRFEYVCQKHGKQNVSYNGFVNIGSRCAGCAKDENIKRLRGDGNGNGYFPERKDEQDYLYVLNFNDKFIKVGRSFDVDNRIYSLKTPSVSGIKNITKLRIFTATHQEIYDLEQELHNELRERNFQHYVDWSTECFENDCKYVLNGFLDDCGYEEIR